MFCVLIRGCLFWVSVFPAKPIYLNHAAAMTTLDQILAATRERVVRAKERAQVRPLEKAAAAHTPRGFRKRLAAMSQLGPAVIGELKKASPSKGTIRGTFPVGVLANQLARGGASALVGADR